MKTVCSQVDSSVQLAPAQLECVSDVVQPVIDVLKKEVERLEKIAAHFEKAKSMHYESVVKLICSIEQNIKMLEARRAKSAA
jgi:hypothetical protein